MTGGRAGGHPEGLSPVTLANSPPAPELPGALHSGKVRDLYEITEGPHTGSCSW